MRVISLFAGIGGFDLGFARAGLECVAQVEFNAAASSVLARHYPHVERFEDVRDVGRHNLPAADLVCGGFPCQDVSVAGKRAGLAGERSGLWFEFLRILTELRPRWAVIENVPGLLSSNGGRDFAAIVHGLVECGYRVAWRVLDAQYFGVPQRRRRVFIVGSLGDGRSAEILFERTGGAGHPEPRPQAGQRTAAAAGSGTPSRSYSQQRSDEYRDASVDATLASRDYKSATDLVAIDLQQVTSAANRSTPAHQSPPLTTEQRVVAFAEAIDVRNSRSNGDVSGTLQSKANGGYSLNYQNPIVIKSDNTNSNGWGVLEDGTTHTLGGTTDAIAFMAGAGSTRSIDAHEDMSPTLRSANSGLNQAPSVSSAHGVRRLTPTECERLQGFPDGWTAGQSDSQRYRQLGNAVCVNVAEWLGRKFAEVSS